MTKKGLNDASGVVWALGEFFFFSFSVLLTTTGSNDARRVIWALLGTSRMFVTTSAGCTTTTTTTTTTYDDAHESQRRPTAANKGQRRPTKTTNDPNDASGVVWALGYFFFVFFTYKLTFLFLFRFYLCFTTTKRVWMGCEAKTGPKRRQMRRLGP
jgi:hypothetical protein